MENTETGEGLAGMTGTGTVPLPEIEDAPALAQAEPESLAPEEPADFAIPADVSGLASKLEPSVAPIAAGEGTGALESSEVEPSEVEPSAIPVEPSLALTEPPRPASKFVPARRKIVAKPAPAQEDEDSVDLFPPPRRPRGARLVAGGAIMLGTFGAGLALSLLFASAGPAPHRAPATPIALAAASPAATSAALAPPPPAFVAPTFAPDAESTPSPVAKPATKVRAKPAAAASKKTGSGAREELGSWEKVDRHQPGPDTRVVHALSGKKSLQINKPVAVTGKDGKTFVGTLVDVKNGVLEVKTPKARVKVAEGNVKDVANY